jgi:hypothetical protein
MGRFITLIFGGIDTWDFSNPLTDFSPIQMEKINIPSINGVLSNYKSGLVHDNIDWCWPRV